MTLALPSFRALLLPLVLGACAHGGERMERVALSPSAYEDPWEPSNRTLFAASNKVDRVLLRPTANAYRAVVPEAARRGVSNFYNTQNESRNFLNALFQGKIKSAFRAVDRVLVNGVLGLGLADHATDMGLDTERHDFGQTMAVWGVPSGPYVVMPFFGPSTARDATGFFVDFFGDPLRFVERRLLSPEEQILELGLTIVDLRAGLLRQGDQLLAGSADPYATTRAAWLQLRRYQLFDGNPPMLEEEAEPLPPLPPLPAEAQEGEP